MKEIKNNNPKITVITPTFNRANLIKETIDSVISQSFMDFEYLIIDDGSTDNTEEVVQPYLKDKRIKYIKKVNSGEADTVNFGWSIAKGEYFTQVNSDDPILPGLFEEMVGVFKSKPNIVVAYPDFYLIDGDGKIISRDKNEDWNFYEALKKFACYAAAPGAFINKKKVKWKFLKDLKYRYISDVDMYWRMAIEGDFYHVKKFLATWRSHSAGISHDRYKSIYEVEEWLNHYLTLKSLPKKIVDNKVEIKNGVYLYFISLLSISNDPNKNNKIIYYKNKLSNKKWEFNNLQFGDNDLIGNKFNGHDLHIALRDKNVESNHLVWNKESKDKNTYIISGSDNNRNVVRDLMLKTQKKYSLNGVYNPFTYDLIFNKLFLD